MINQPRRRRRRRIGRRTHFHLGHLRQHRRLFLTRRQRRLPFFANLRRVPFGHLLLLHFRQHLCFFANLWVHRGRRRRRRRIGRRTHFHLGHLRQHRRLFLTRRQRRLPFFANLRRVPFGHLLLLHFRQHLCFLPIYGCTVVVVVVVVELGGVRISILDTSGNIEDFFLHDANEDSPFLPIYDESLLDIFFFYISANIYVFCQFMGAPWSSSSSSSNWAAYAFPSWTPPATSKTFSYTTPTKTPPADSSTTSPFWTSSSSTF